MLAQGAGILTGLPGTTRRFNTTAGKMDRYIINVLWELNRAWRIYRWDDAAESGAALPSSITGLSIAMAGG